MQISDENVHLVRCLMDEVFGSENFCALITVQKTTRARRQTLIGGVLRLLDLVCAKRTDGTSSTDTLYA